MVLTKPNIAFPDSSPNLKAPVNRGLSLFQVIHKKSSLTTSESFYHKRVQPEQLILPPSFTLTPNSLFLLDTFQFTFGNEPTLTTNVGQNFAFDNRFIEAAQQLFW